MYHTLTLVRVNIPDCPFPCKEVDGRTSTLFTNISFERIRGSTSKRTVTSGTKTIVAEFKCTASTPCTNITMWDVLLTDRAGHPGKLDCENVQHVGIYGSSPDACATMHGIQTYKPIV
eukprot:COSAG02_NODE_359_length_23842_cov_22.550011_10_plen_118_part_00